HSLSQENGTRNLARRPPSWMTEAQKVRANAFVKNHFIQMLQKVPNDEKLCYTWYSIALDKKEKSKKCHTVLVQKVETWLKEKTEVRLGIDQDSGRKMLSPDFLDACCPKLINRDPVITTLYIHGPVAITDCLKLRDTIRSMEQLANLHFKLNKKSAEYFIKELSHILENRTITIITLHNFSETNDMVIEPSVYDTLDNQNQCGITFTNIPKPNKQFNQLTFN
ncbi:MAG: hypothetical protein KDK60_00445, partial [Chlamydiia bacterium]|nr:hypothetical protein [Chlamydiia bacterium]